MHLRVCSPHAALDLCHARDRTPRRSSLHGKPARSANARLARGLQRIYYYGMHVRGQGSKPRRVSTDRNVAIIRAGGRSRRHLWSTTARGSKQILSLCVTPSLYTNIAMVLSRTQGCVLRLFFGVRWRSCTKHNSGPSTGCALLPVSRACMLDPLSQCRRLRPARIQTFHRGVGRPDTSPAGAPSAAEPRQLVSPVGDFPCPTSTMNIFDPVRDLAILNQVIMLSLEFFRY